MYYYLLQNWQKHSLWKCNVDCQELESDPNSAVFTCIGALGTPSRTGPHWPRQGEPTGAQPPMAGQKRFYC